MKLLVENPTTLMLNAYYKNTIGFMQVNPSRSLNGAAGPPVNRVWK